MALLAALLSTNQGSGINALVSASMNVAAGTLLVCVLRHSSNGTAAWANINSFTDNKGNVWQSKVLGHHNSNAGNESTLDFWWTYVAAAQTGVVVTTITSKSVATFQQDIIAISGLVNPDAPFDTNTNASKVSGGQSSGGSFGNHSTNAPGMVIYAMMQEDQGDPSKLLTVPSGTTSLRLHDRLNGLGWIGQISSKYNAAPLVGQAASWTPSGISSGGCYGALAINDAPYTPPAPRQVVLNMMQ